MNWKIGLFAGVVIGALGWEWSGAIVLGFVGWLIGIIAGSKKSSEPVVRKGAVPSPARAAESNAARIERLERSMATLETRLARLEGGAVPAVIPASPEEPVVEFPPVSEIPPPIPPPIPEAPPPVPEVPAPPKEPPQPNAIARLLAWFTGGNTIVRVGAVIFFFGLVFLLNYAREHQMIPAELRVAGVAIVGIVLLVIGWRLRDRNTGYAVSLQGAGVATLYLTVFAAMRLYHLVPPAAAFFLLAAIAAFSAVIAVGQNSLALAVIGAGGGFLAPILASTGSGNHVALFSYYLILNLGIVAIAWFKAWRVLNVVGFVFTFLIACAWGERSYNADLFDSTEPFLIAFFLLYLAIAILFARSSSAAGTGPSSSALPSGSSGRGSKAFVDGTIVFGNPLAAFGFQAAMIHHIEFGLAYSSLAMATIYIVLATVLFRLKQERWNLLAESFLALGVVFATLAIPLALDARWTSAAWALEGAAIVWVGVRQQRTLARAFGMLLQLGAGLAYIIGYSRMPAGTPLVDAPFVGAMLIALAGIWTQRLLSTGGDRVTKTEVAISPAPFIWGLAWLILAGHHEIEAFLPRETRINAHAALFGGIALAFTILARARQWPAARWPGFALLPALWVTAVVALLDQSHPFAAYGWFAWPFAVAVLVFVLHDLDRGNDRTESYSPLHIGTFLLVSALGAWEMNWAAAQVTAHGTSWSVAAVLLVPAMLLLFAVSKEVDNRWPLARHLHAYRMGAVMTVLVLMGVWILYANATHDGTSTPLPYLPIVNAIDLGHILIAICIMGSVIAWRRSNLRPPEAFRDRSGWSIAGVFGFIWLNGMLLRSVHHWADVPYTARAMNRSVVAQASLSIFWTLIALTLMVYATRRGMRALWMVGGALLAVVVVKLFLIDLGHLAGIERIVAFIAVGLLMLVVGYFSPVPPRRKEEAP